MTVQLFNALLYATAAAAAEPKPSLVGYFTSSETTEEFVGPFPSWGNGK